MPSAWIEHIRDFAKQKKLSFGCALSDPECSRTYRLKKNPLPIAEPKSKQQQAKEMRDAFMKGYVPKEKPVEPPVETPVEPVKKKKSPKKAPIELVIEEEPPVVIKPIMTKEEALKMAERQFDDWTNDTIEDFYNDDMTLKISQRKYDSIVSKITKEIGKEYGLPKNWR
jgi:uncharacterized membrane-anchored protein YjiN (DUF445 family)